MRGLLLCLTLFLIEVGLFFAISSIPFLPGERSFYVTQANQLGNQTSTSTTPQLFVMIFTNNYRIALIEMVPLLGVILFAVSIWETARVIEAIAAIHGESALLLVLLLFAIYPHTYIELPAYAVATAEGIYLLYAIAKALGWNKGNMRAEVYQLAINVAIVTVMLAVAALFESVEIALGLSFWITWVPFVALIYVVVRLNRRLSKIREEAESATIAPPAQTAQGGVPLS